MKCYLLLNFMKYNLSIAISGKYTNIKVMNEKTGKPTLKLIGWYCKRCGKIVSDEHLKKHLREIED